MKRKISLFCIVLSMSIIVNQIVFASEDVKNESNDETQIKLLLNNYFKDKYESLAHLKMNSKMKSYFDSEQNLEYMDLDTLIKFRKIQNTDLSFEKYNCDIKFRVINVSGNMAKVSLGEYTKINYNCSEGIVSEEEQDHIFDLEKKNGKWNIKGDDIEGEFKETFKSIIKDNKDNKAVIKNKQTEIIKTAKAYQEQLNQQQIISPKNLELDTTASAKKKYKLTSYNRNKAKAYALKYALKPNPNYPFYSGDGDCTNFTSQCLKAGGIIEDKQGKEESKKWYRYNSSWKGAQMFHNYWRENKGSSSVKGLKASKTNMKGCRLGDIVQKVPWNKKVGQYTATHSVIISGYVPNPLHQVIHGIIKRMYLFVNTQTLKRKIC